MPPRKWTPELIRATLEPIVEKYGQLPPKRILIEKGMFPLARAILRNGGFRHWNREMGCNPLTETWSKKKVLEQLEPIIEQLGRMPTRNELLDMNLEKLSNAVTRTGGFETWRTLLGVRAKKSTTTRGRLIESKLSLWLLRKGFNVERMPYKHPFDLLVNGWAVDVKSTTMYRTVEYTDVYNFTLGSKEQHNCDFYFLCCLDDENEIIRRYVIPAEECPLSGVNIQADLRADSKYNKYLEAYNLLRE